MALDSASCASNIATAYRPMSEDGNTGGWASAFANSYHNYAEAGVIAGAISGGGDKTIIEAAINNATSSKATIDILAQAFTDYWTGTGLAPAPPNIASANDAASKFSAFKAAIESIITQSESKPFFKNLIDAVEGVAKTIVWTITPPPPASPFLSTVS